MVSKSVKLTSLTLTIFTLGFTGCATDQAAKLRNDKPATVGIWGGAYRPNGNVGVVTDLNGLVSPQTDHRHVDANGDIKAKKSAEPVSQNISSRQSKKVDLGVHLYPSGKSGFFYGIGGSRRKSDTNFDSPSVGSSLTNPSYSNVQVSDEIYAVGPSIGWDWIWSNGITALLDLGPRWDVSKSRNIKEDGDGVSNVDIAQRDKLLKKIDNNSGINLIEPRLIVGYSF